MCLADLYDSNLATVERVQSLLDAHHQRAAERASRAASHTFSPAPASPSRDALGLPLDRAGAGDSIPHVTINY